MAYQYEIILKNDGHDEKHIIKSCVFGEGKLMERHTV